MKKVLVIIGSLKIGGQEKVGKEIGLHIDRNKYEIHYLVFDENKEAYEQELNKAGIQVFHFPEPSRGYIQYLKKLAELMKKNSYDIVHAHTMFNCGWAMLLAWYMKVPCRISHSHSIKMADHHYSILAIVYQFVMQKLIHIFGTEFIGCGKAAGKWLFGKKFFEKHGKVIYLCSLTLCCSIAIVFLFLTLISFFVPKIFFHSESYSTLLELTSP